MVHNEDTEEHVWLIGYVFGESICNMLSMLSKLTDKLILQA